jgi:hypothetical protein
MASDCINSVTDSLRGEGASCSANRAGLAVHNGLGSVINAFLLVELLRLGLGGLMRSRAERGGGEMKITREMSECR